MRQKMMIIESNIDVLNMLTLIFEEEGYTVIALSSEKNMLEKVISEKPDVIVIDILESSKESTGLSCEIRSVEEIKHIPIIALSTHVHPEKIHSICADKILGKPFDLYALIDAVESEVPVQPD
jgi:CheY-like chemotaxis protein